MKILDHEKRIAQLEADVANLQEVLGTLIAWMLTDLGSANVKALIDKIHEAKPKDGKTEQ